MFPKRSHILAPLTALVRGKGPLKWTDECQCGFVQMKATMAHDAFLRYPDHNKPFHIGGAKNDQVGGNGRRMEYCQKQHDKRRVAQECCSWGNNAANRRATEQINRQLLQDLAGGSESRSEENEEGLYEEEVTSGSSFSPTMSEVDSTKYSEDEGFVKDDDVLSSHVRHVSTILALPLACMPLFIFDIFLQHTFCFLTFQLL
jgi:hypothetical protein